MSLRNTNDLQKNQPLSGPTVDFQGRGMGGGGGCQEGLPCLKMDLVLQQ